MWIAPRFGENPPSYSCDLVLAAAGLPHRNAMRDAILLAYEARNLPSPLILRAHSTRGVASSQALFRVVPLEDICVAAGWSSPHTFVKFYNLDVDTAPGSQILSVVGSLLFLAWRVWYIVPKA